MLKTIVPTLFSLHFSPIISKHRTGAPLAPNARENPDQFAKIISSLGDSSSIVISVNAPWGEGKTSVLNMIEEELNKAGNVLVIRFNPWRFPDEERLLLYFFQTLADCLEVNLKEVSERSRCVTRQFAWTLDTYTQAVTTEKRNAQAAVVALLLPEKRKKSEPCFDKLDYLCFFCARQE